MRIDEVIAAVKGYCLGISPWTGEQIDEATTRDKVTYGTTEKECTGVVTCIWPTVDIVRQAMRCDANLIISHEALFWSHGDHQDVIGGTRAYAEKKALRKRSVKKERPFLKEFEMAVNANSQVKVKAKSESSGGVKVELKLPKETDAEKLLSKLAELLTEK